MDTCLALCILALLYGDLSVKCCLLWLLQKKRLSSKPKAQVELGTQNNKSDVDYDWLPRETLQDLSESSNFFLQLSLLVQCEFNLKVETVCGMISVSHLSHRGV